MVLWGVHYRQLGSSGLTISAVGLGCNNFGRICDRDQTRAVVLAAVDSGITFFDTADSYGDGYSEEFLGAALEGIRDRVVIATKFGNARRAQPEETLSSRRGIRKAVEVSLRRLGTDYIDLYQMHYPEERTPIEETLAALQELVLEGKVRYVGCSNFSAWQVVEAEFLARSTRSSRFISAQNAYNLIEADAEQELLPACQRFGVGLIPFRPLANGLLTGKYRRGEPAPTGTRLAGRPKPPADEIFARVESLEGYAKERGLSLLEAAIGGLAAQPAVGSVIAGATTPDQVRANARAGEWQPSREDLRALAELRASFSG